MNLNVQVSVLMEHDELNFNIQFFEHIKLTKKVYLIFFYGYDRRKDI